VRQTLFRDVYVDGGGVAWCEGNGVNKVRNVNENSRMAAREKKFKLDKRLTRRSRRTAVSTIYVRTAAHCDDDASV
jgi:hypothetical protein